MSAGRTSPFLIRPAIAAARSPIERGLAAAASDAPYLAQLIARSPDVVERLQRQGPNAVLDEAIEAVAGLHSLEDAMPAMRQAKAQAHLAIAIADLAGLWSLSEVTEAMTAFADAALKSALNVATSTLETSGDLAIGSAPAPQGLILIAMGKHGAGELNYSSDIDFSVFYDRSSLPVGARREPGPVAVRLAQGVVKILEEVTVEGYVFRCDLRLRPDPASTPVAVSLSMAENYYQTVGQNWERAAFIKARAAAGDIPAGEAFLAALKSFIWRKHLDFAAIADVRSIKRQILQVKAGGVDLDDPVCDVKLGRGGIRDIELFAQTQQLILGGRNTRLQARGTLAALDGLVAAGALKPTVRDALSEAYVFLRGVEHRVQMLNDEQTHRLPADPGERARVARLAGYSDLAAFDAAVIAARKAVAAADATLFRPQESLADPMGRLSFTGVEDDPDTLETLRRLGFERPEVVTETIRGWHHGRIRATRTPRARELLTALTPRLLRALAAAGAADLAFARFRAFLERLPAGVQLLSLLDSQDALLTRLADVLTLAPRLSELLAAKPETLDAMLDPHFFEPLHHDAPGARRLSASAAVAWAKGYEAALDAVRRFQREEGFRIDVQAIQRLAKSRIVGVAHADLADACVSALADLAHAEQVARAGPAPGPFTVVALGKFGGRELAEGSDLDLMVIYDAPMGSGAAEWFTRLTQRLIAALSAPTAEGGLYDVDMQLRPSGSKGPVAVRLSSFERYYAEEAWTWELMALTRLRPVAGDAALGVRVAEIARAALMRPRDRAQIRADVADMRARMDRQRPGGGLWDLKLAPGGLVDLEFVVQLEQLLAAQDGVDLIHANTGEALHALRVAGRLERRDAWILIDGWHTYSMLQQIMRAAAPAPFQIEEIGAPLKKRLCEAVNVADLERLERLIIQRKQRVRETFLTLVAEAGDGTRASTRSISNTATE